MGYHNNMKYRSFADVDGMLQRRNRNGRKLGNNTYLIRHSDECIGLRLHSTDVVTFTPEHIELNTGGWWTATTRERINWGMAGTGKHVTTDKGVWYVSKVGEWKDHRTEFTSGMRLTYRGWIISSNGGENKERERIRKLITEYVKGFDPSKLGDMSGDCWYCLMRTEEGKTLGDTTGNADHLITHMEEGYYMRSLLYRAFETCYNRENGIARWMADRAVSDWEKSKSDRDNVRHCLRKYLKRELLGASVKG